MSDNCFKRGGLPRVHKDLVKYHHKISGAGQPGLRAAILIHKSLETYTWVVPELTNRDQVVICLRTNSKLYVIASTYMDGAHDEAPPSFFLPVIQYANSNNAVLIIGSDTNSRHELWGDRLTNKRGDDLLNFMVDNSVTWMNSGSTPTFCNTSNHSSIIDLTITNGEGATLIQNWTVSTRFSNSDHRYIKFNVDLVNHDSKQQLRLVRKTDWSKYKDEVKNHTDLDALTSASADIQSPEQADDLAYRLNIILTDAYHSSCPITYTSTKIKKTTMAHSRGAQTSTQIQHSPHLGTVQEPSQNLQETAQEI